MDRGEAGGEGPALLLCGRVFTLTAWQVDFPLDSQDNMALTTALLDVERLARPRGVPALRGFSLGMRVCVCGC